MASDAAGRLTSQTDRLGRRKDFSYDNANRLTGVTQAATWSTPRPSPWMPMAIN
jgi:hypothetical protein